MPFKTHLMMRVLVVVLTLMISTSNSASTISDPMQAHEVPPSGAWFEGWYTRVTDPANGVSFAFIAATARHSSRARAWTAAGYEAVIVERGGKTRAEQNFPVSTTILNTGRDFKWSAGKNQVSTSLASMDVGALSVQLQVVERKEWGEAGPEGRLADLPIPLHWYVHNTTGFADYTLEIDGQRISGQGRVHQEKNWGEVFPSAWVWAQASADDAYLALAGGDLQTGLLKTHSYLIGYRSTDFALDFNVGAFATFKDSIDACTNRIHVDASNLTYRLEIEAIGGSDFVSLAIPTATGYSRDGAKETFTAKVRTRLYKRGWFSDDLLEERIFTNAALEFGAASQVCHSAQ